MANSVTKAELVSTIANEVGLKRADAERALGALTGAIQGALAGGQKVTLVGFGTFSVQQRRARKGLNPRTGESMDIPASKNVKFKPGKAMKDAVNG